MQRIRGIALGLLHRKGQMNLCEKGSNPENDRGCTPENAKKNAVLFSNSRDSNNCRIGEVKAKEVRETRDDFVGNDIRNKFCLFYKNKNGKELENSGEQICFANFFRCKTNGESHFYNKGDRGDDCEYLVYQHIFGIY